MLLPAVDVADGQAVRLVQGEAGSETSYGEPLAAALAWQRAGAEWVHLVDLDAAFGRGENRELLAEVVGRLDVEVELSGGIRDDASLEAALATGCARVNIGTAALEDPEWCASAIARHGDRVAVGLDVRGTTLAARGWTQDGGELFEVLARLDRDGCARYVVTDVGRDGTMTGPNLDLLREVCAATDRPVVASGGVSSLADLRAIATLVPVGVEGAIVGKALYAGRVHPGGCVGGGVVDDRTTEGLQRCSVGAVVGYSRAVAAGDNIWVTGCTSIVDGEVVHDGDPYEQTAQAIRNIAWALGQLGVVAGRRRPHPDVRHRHLPLGGVGRAHGEAFGEILPATSMVQVSALIDPRMLVEVEAVAYKPGSGW